MQKKISPDLQVWIEARKRYRLSHARVQMARELGLNPRKVGSLNNHKQEPWKVPFPEFIEQLYLKRFGKAVPDEVVTIEERAQRQAEKKAARKEAREASRQEGAPES
jgi:phage protein D